MAMKNDDVIETLNELIETSKDGERGFETCSKHAHDPMLRDLLNHHARTCHQAIDELSPLVIEYGGKPDVTGSASEALHRGWVAVRGSFGAMSDLDVLEECERSEDMALRHYREALDDGDMPTNVRLVVERQMLGLQRNHEQIRQLREQQRRVG